MTKTETTYAVIEPGMISFREGDDKLPRPLITRVHIDSTFLQSGRVHERDELEEEIRLRLEEIRCFAPDRSLKFVRVVAGDAIPRLSLAPMHCPRTISKGN